MMPSVLLAALLILLRLALFHWEARPFTLAASGMVVAFAFVAAIACVRLRQVLRTGGSRVHLWAIAAWWAAAMIALLVAPETVHPERHPLATWLAMIAAGGLAFAAPFEPGRSPSDDVRFLSQIGMLLLTIAAVATLKYFVTVRPHVGSVDFFYYVSYARDMLRSDESVHPGAYSYFPGVYDFWRTIIYWFGPNLQPLQVAHLLVVAAVGITLGFAVYQLTDNRWLAVTAPFFYWVWASRFEGFAGITEPLATLFFILGLIAFGGEPLRGHAGWRRAVLCGIAWGLCVVCKQQAGLLTLGYLVLVVGKLRYRAVDAWPQLLAIPGAAAIVFCWGILREGHGWQPLVHGVLTAAEYPASSNWWSNIYVQVRNDESAFLAALVSGAALGIVSLRYAEHREWPSWLRVVQVAVLGALATFVQFERRAYGHYLLLAIPSLVLAYTTVAWYCFSTSLERRLVFHPLMAWMTFGLFLFPLFYTGGNPNNLHVWQVLTPRLEGLSQWHEQPQVQRDLQRLRAIVRSTEPNWLVLPRYRNDVYFLTGVRASPMLGYGYAAYESDEIPWHALEGIVVVAPEFDTHPERPWHEQKMQPIIRAMEAHSFEVAEQLPTMTVYRRAK